MVASKKAPVAQKTTVQSTASTDLNSLLELTEEDQQTAPAEPDHMEEPVPEEAATFESVAAEVEDEEDAELARLQAELDKPAPVYETEKLTPKQRQIQELRDKLAQRQAEEIAAAAPAYEQSTDPNAEKILIHVLEDGITLQGEVWYRGQEIEFTVGSKAHQQTFNRHGKSWLDMASDEEAQYNRWGKLYFREGPWRGRSLTQVTLADLPPDATEVDLERVRRAASKRRDAPILK